VLLSKMYGVGLLERTTNIDIVIQEYENILLDIGLLGRINKVFEDHKLVVSSTPVTPDPDAGRQLTEADLIAAQQGPIPVKDGGNKGGKSRNKRHNIKKFNTKKRLNKYYRKRNKTRKIKYNKTYNRK